MWKYYQSDQEHDENARKMATELQDNKLLAKISSGDMVATDDNYYKQYLTSYHIKAIAFVQLVSY